jgi:hypothetical protein
MTYEVIPYEAQPLAERWNYAGMLSQAGDLIPKSLQVPIRNESNAVVGYEPSPGKVMLVLEVGASLGLHPTAALANVYVIEGRVSMSAQLMTAVIRRAGHRIRVETSGSWADGDFQAVATLTRTDDEAHEYRVVWTRERAERAGLLGKDNWQHYPEPLCVARATTEVVRQGGSDVVLGIGYTPEELGARVDASGAVLTLEQLERAPEAAEDEARPMPTATARKTPTKGRQGTRKRAAKDVEPEPAPDGAPEGAVGGNSEATEPQAPTDVDASAGEVVVTLEAGVPVADGPMAGLVPTEAQVAAAEQMRQLQEQGTDTTVAEVIMATEIPEAPLELNDAGNYVPADDDGPAVLANASTGEVAEPAGDFASAAWAAAAKGEDGHPFGADLAAYVAQYATGHEDMLAVWMRAESEGILTTDLRRGLINAKGAAAARAAQA